MFITIKKLPSKDSLPQNLFVCFKMNICHIFLLQQHMSLVSKANIIYLQLKTRFWKEIESTSGRSDKLSNNDKGSLFDHFKNVFTNVNTQVNIK